MTFSAEQLKLLRAPLDDSRVKTREKNRLTLRYVEGHDVIDQANAVFGYEMWSYRIASLELHGRVWVARVEVTVMADGAITSREDVGVGVPAASRDAEPSDDAIETAVKAAVTDALKRALRTFGNAFGNSLYDKGDGDQGEQSQQASAAPQQRAPARQQAKPEDRNCDQCGAPMNYREGTTRDGKPYRAYFCSTKCGASPVWLDRGQR